MGRHKNTRAEPEVEARKAWVHEAEGWVLRTVIPTRSPFRERGRLWVIETGQLVNENDRVVGPRESSGRASAAG